MKSIQLTDLKPGMVAQNELYSDKGELLIAQGVSISDRIITLMEKRNVFTLFYKTKNESEELDKLIAGDFQKLDPLNFDEDPVVADLLISEPDFVHVPLPAPKALLLPEIKSIRKGREGLQQLQQSKKALELDKIIRTQNLPDKPFGVPLEKKASQIAATDRTEEYKTSVSSSYTTALEETTAILTALADGAWCDSHRIKGIVERFVKLFVTDHAVLLNIACSRHSDEYVFHHSLNVCLLSINIAAAFGYSEQQIVEIGIGALLHDIGMLLIPDAIRFKRGKLADDERFEIEKHPILGLHLLEKVKKLPYSVPYVAYHAHERENGTGYPKQRNGRLIHGFAKVVQIADMYEAMCSPRPYRQAMLPFRAMAHLIFLSKTNVVSHGLLKAFLKYASLFPVGSLVELSDHSIGKVVDSNGLSYSKPVVAVLTDETGNLVPETSRRVVNLARDIDYSIIRALPFNVRNDVDLMTGF